MEAVLTSMSFAVVSLAWNTVPGVWKVLSMYLLKNDLEWWRKRGTDRETADGRNYPLRHKERDSQSMAHSRYSKYWMKKNESSSPIKESMGKCYRDKQSPRKTSNYRSLSGH